MNVGVFFGDLPLVLIMIVFVGQVSEIGFFGLNPS